MKWALGLGLLALGSIASAQSQARLDAIWDAAVDRMTQQIDVWFDDGEFPKVIQLLKVENVMYPHDYEIATNLGWMQGNISQYDEELATYLRYKQQNPVDPDRVLPEAQFYYMKHAYAKVIDLLEPYDKTKSHPNVWRMLATSYRKQKMYADSKRVLEAYLKLHPDDEQAKRNLEGVEKDLEKGTG